jgi:hypothetical protein
LLSTRLKSSYLAQEIFRKVGEVVGLRDQLTLEQVLFVLWFIAIAEEKLVEVIEPKELDGSTSTLTSISTE